MVLVKHLKITAMRAEQSLDHIFLAGLAQGFAPVPQLRLQPYHSWRPWLTQSLSEAGGLAEAHTAQKELM